MTQVAEVMTRGVRHLSPRDSMAVAAKAMQQLDVGVLPVCEGDRLVGLVTDRDLVVRGLAEGRPADQTPLGELMSPAPQACFEDQSVDEVLERMREARVRRIPVLNRSQALVGMLSLGDVAVRSDGDGAAVVLQELSASTPPATPATATTHARSDERETAPARAAEGQSLEMREHRAEAAVAGTDGADDAPHDGRAARGRTVWVLVADDAIARILQQAPDGDALESVEELTDPAAHDKEGEMRDAAYGRRAGPAGVGARGSKPGSRGPASVTASAADSPRHREAHEFARRVASHLAEALRQRRFDELHIVAAPRFLGHLRKELDAHVGATVVAELNKDLVHLANADIRRRVFGHGADRSADDDQADPDAA